MSWNEAKGDRFEHLRNRKAALSVAEAVELAELTKELEGIETSFVSDDTNRKLSRTSRRSDSESGQGPSLRRRVACFAYGFLLTLVLTVAASVYAMSTALSWPLSELNLQYALIQGAVLGAVAGLALGAGGSATKCRSVCFCVVSIASVAWAAITGFVFFVFVAGSAAC